MCLILFAHRADPAYPLVFAANRDEFYERPTAPARFWEDAPEVLAGRDLRAGGTWMGVTRAGRWAAVTNYRDPTSERAGARSRGELVSDYLRGGAPAARHIGELRGRADEYSGFNLLVADETGVYYFGNRLPPEAMAAAVEPLAPGVYGLSNHLLDTPWPKVRRGKELLQRELNVGVPLDRDAVFRILAVTDMAPDTELPNTGVGPEWERVLSSPFILSPAYGTRASTVLTIDAARTATFVERSFRPGRAPGGEVRHAFPLLDPHSTDG